MRWFKIMDGETVTGAEAHEEPQFVRRLKNGVIDLCEPEKAQGITSLDQTCYYQLDGRDSLGVEDALTAAEITEQEWQEITRELPDPEDTEPEIPVDAPAGVELMTRAQLTAKVIEQGEEIRDLNEQIDLLLSGVTA